MPDAGEVDRWLDELEDYHPVIVWPQDEGPLMYFAATISFGASTLREATQKALRLVEDATGGRANGVEVLLTVNYDWRLAEPSVPQLVGYAGIADMLGVSRQRAREIASTTESFPASAVQVESGPLYVRSNVEAWAKTWERKPGRPRKAPSSEPQA